MARSLRLLIPGGYYHVTVRGNERRAIFRDDVDRERFLGILGRVVEEESWKLLTYCLMPNHFHLLVLTPKANLSGGMQRLNGTYAQWFNLRHERVGHLFQGRYGATPVDDDGQFHATVRYIVRNALRAELCRSVREWPWSSHLAVLGWVVAPRFLAVDALLAHYGTDRRSARDRYQAAAERADRSQLDRELPRPSQPSLTAILEGAVGTAAIAAASAQGYSLREIARHLGVDASTVSRRLRRHATIGV